MHSAKKRIWSTIGLWFVMLTMTVVVSACGGNLAEKPVTASYAPESSASVVKTKSRTLKHMFGETEMPEKWGNLAVLYPRYADALLALGIEPSAISAAYNGEFPPYLEKIMDEKGIKKLGTGTEANLEEILAAEPDLIVAGYFHDKVYPELSKIAPTVAVEDIPWREMLHQIAGFFAKEEEANKVIADYEFKAAEAKERLAASVAGKSVLLMRVDDKQLNFFPADGTSVSDILYNDLGLTFPPKLEGNDSGSLSLEVMPDINPDYIFVELHAATQTQKTYENVNSSVIWKNLDAVKKGNVFLIDHNQWLQGDGPIGSSEIIDEVLEMLNNTK